MPTQQYLYAHTLIACKYIRTISIQLAILTCKPANKICAGKRRSGAAGRAEVSGAVNSHVSPVQGGPDCPSFHSMSKELVHMRRGCLGQLYWII